MLQKRPWLWIVFAFVALIAAWSFLIRIAMENQPERVPLVNERRDDHAGN